MFQEQVSKSLEVDITRGIAYIFIVNYAHDHSLILRPSGIGKLVSIHLNSFFPSVPSSVAMSSVPLGAARGQMSGLGWLPCVRDQHGR